MSVYRSETFRAKVNPKFSNPLGIATSFVRKNRYPSSKDRPSTAFNDIFQDLQHMKDKYNKLR